MEMKQIELVTTITNPTVISPVILTDAKIN